MRQGSIDDLRSTADDVFRRGQERGLDLMQKNRLRPVFSRARILEANVDWKQLPIQSSETLVDEDGTFWFLVGYSQVGGGDRIRP